MECIWRLHVPRRVRNFLWLALRDQLLTNVERRRRHLTMDGACPVCAQGDEDLDNVLHGCVRTKTVWSHLVHPNWLNVFHAGSFTQWFTDNLFEEGHVRLLGRDWKLLFAITCWALWQWRFHFVFNAGCELL
ncbi:hypothetical protein like AT2G02650 [Hibiscus trionum]|uniref:Reverse transcriptase zinc-binding domain-containing protein n=1 Tax=Hibiscus trionum TaxID=183268 RepID=A0A9W7IYN8_HIBTR|nr:hypothetical protein like AT2G02650 [Hibiscus trionum]